MSLTKVTYAMIDGAPINVLDFGADPTGAADSTAAITAAIASMTSASSLYFPAGIYKVIPTSSSDYIFKLPDVDNIAIFGDGDSSIIRVGANAGNYRGIIGMVSAANINGLSVHNIQFDHNAPNNLLPDLAAYSAQGRYTVSNFGGGLNFDCVSFLNVLIRNCDSVVSIYFTGGATGTGSLSVVDCKWVDATNFQGQDYDQSFINCRTDIVTITNNQFSGVSWAYAPRTAIETHSSNQIVANNTIERFQIGMNITGISQTGTTYDHIINNNNVVTSRNGILLWSGVLAPASPTIGFENMLVSNNTINLDPNNYQFTAPSGFGAIVLVNQTGRLGVVNLNIKNNIISYPLDISGSSYTTKSSTQNWGGLNFYDSLNPTGVATNVKIANNKIINCPTSGIFIEFGTWDGGVIENNTLINCGSTQNPSPLFANKTAIYFAGYLDDDISISRNLIIDNLSTTQVTDYIFVRDRSSPSVYYFNVWDNEFRFIDGATILAGADYLGVFSSAVLVSFRGNLPLADNPRLPALTGAIQSTAVVRSSNIRYVKNASATTAWQANAFGTAAPTTGTWKVGDVVLDTAPVAAGNIGWVCTTAGTPGTWKTFGTIAA